MFDQQVSIDLSLNNLLPNLQAEERLFVKEITADLSCEELEDFAVLYSQERKSYSAMLILSLFGFLGLAGLQRFYVKQYFLGVIYLITIGFGYVGTIYDTVTYKRRTNQYNYKVALKCKKIAEHF